MAQWVKRLPHKHEDLIASPELDVVISTLGKRGDESPGSLTSSLALLESSRPERCCLENQGAHFLWKDIRNLRLASHTQTHSMVK